MAPLVLDLLPQMPGFTCGLVCMGFVVDRVALGQVFSECFDFSLSVLFCQCSTSDIDTV